MIQNLSKRSYVGIHPQKAISEKSLEEELYDQPIYFKKLKKFRS